MLDFKGINAKIDRASGQIATLAADIDAFCANIKRSIVHEIDRDAKEQRWIYRGMTPEVPIEWSIRAGEILYNLQSALDHLVWQLVLVNGQKPTQINQFPILEDAAEWTNSRTKNCLKGVGNEDRILIRGLQPFNPFLVLPINGEYRPCKAQVFRTLRDLCNIDKHRHLNLILACAYGIEPMVFGENHPPRRPDTQPLKGRGKIGKIEQNMILLTMDDVEQELKPEFVLGVNFHGLNIDILTQNSVKKQLRECLEAIQGGCALFRHS